MSMNLENVLRANCIFTNVCAEEEIKRNQEACKESNMRIKFYYCKHCGKIINVVKDSGVPTICCGEEMEELIPITEDSGMEKHIPVIKIHGNHVTVTVGSTLHPMAAEHYIEWILLQTTQGLHKKWLKPGEEPKAEFAIVTGEKVCAAYEYCNIHRLWKK